jgi:long-chain acyl-CoA synthetase
MGCGASVKFDLPEGAPAPKATDSNAKSVDVGGGIYRKTGFEGALVALPFPDEPDVNSVWKILERSGRVHADINCVGARQYNKDTQSWGEYNWSTYSVFKQLAERFGIGLLGKFPELRAGSHVGIYGPSTLELLVSQYGCHSQALCTTPMYDTWSGEILEHVIVHADLTVLIVSLTSIRPVIDALRKVAGSHKVTGLVVLPRVEYDDIAVDIPGLSVVKYQAVQDHGANNPNSIAVNPPVPDSVAVIMYTSGSSGLPKGVMLSHAGFVGVAAGMNQASGPGMQPGVVVACFLPLGHIYPTSIILACFLGGASTGLYHGDPAALLDDFQAMKPNVLPGVPRVYQTIHTKVVERFQAQNCVAQRVISNAVTKQTDLYRQGKPRDAGLDKKIFSKIQENIGGQLKYATAGASPMLPSLQEWVKVCFNVQFSEGYGLTEAFGVALAQESHWGSTGNVGAPLNCTEVRLQDVPDFGYSSKDTPPRGELCLRGVNIMLGYFKDPEKTAEEIDKDGWLHTGDIAKRNEDGTFSIIDRISNVFKLGASVPGVQGAVLIAPEVIENQLATLGLVNQAWVFGSFNYPHLLAIIVPDANKLFSKAGGTIKSKGDPGWKEEVARLSGTPEAQEWIKKEIQSLVDQKKIKAWEKPMQFYLEGAIDDLGLGFTVQNGLLTPTFKLRRGICKKHYEETLKQMYALDHIEWKK